MKHEVGFWRSLRRLSGEDIFGPELLGAVIIGIGGGVALLANTSVSDRLNIAADFLIVIGPLLGVVFAAFALVIALFSDSYLRLLNESAGGVEGFLRPFIVAIGVQVGAVLAAVAYRAAGDWLPSKVEVGAFLVLCFLFVFALLDVVALGRGVLAHGITRGRDVRVRDLEEQARVLRHPGRQASGDE